MAYERNRLQSYQRYLHLLLALAQREEEDVQQERYSHLSHLEPNRKKEVTAALQKLTDEYYFRGKPGPITEQEFVDMNSDNFKADKAQFKERMQKCFATEYNIFDIDGEGNITKEGFVQAYMGCGHENVESISNFFQSYDPVNNSVPVKTIVHSWVVLTTNEDSSVKDIVKNALETGLKISTEKPVNIKIVYEY